MNFTFSNEQLMVQKMMRKFTETEVKPIAAHVDETEEFPWDTVNKMKRYGLLGMTVPKELGGAGADELSYVIAVEELSRYCGTTGVILSAHNSLACWPVF